jgi:hypothetical protein
MSETCETCKRWDANTVGRILGWCALKGPRPEHPMLLVGNCTSYKDTCEKHSPVSKPGASS